MNAWLRAVVTVCLMGGVDLAHGTPAIGIYTDLQGTQCAGNTTNGILQGSVWADVTEGTTGAEFGIYCSQLWTGNLELIFYPEPGTMVLGDPLRCPLSPAELQVPDPPFADDNTVDDPPPGGWRWKRCGECICWCGDVNGDGADDGIGGVNVVLPACQSGPRVRLLTFVLIEHVPTSDVTLHIVERNPPSNPHFSCPLVTLCDGLAFTKVCADDRERRQFPLIYYTPQTVINSRAGRTCKSLSALPVAVRPVSWSAVKSLYRDTH
jgi:hypothetical protein